jgi:hypothetical protein
LAELYPQTLDSLRLLQLAELLPEVGVEVEFMTNSLGVGLQFCFLSDNCRFLDVGLPL